jgi:hypothetical protein
MTKEEERRMRAYVPELRVLRPGSEALRGVVDEANRVVSWARADL